jgi:DinB superfamily
MTLSNNVSYRLLHQLETLSEIIGTLSEQELRQRVIPDKWSAFENIAHLAAFQPAFIHRLERIGHEEIPVFERYVAEKDPMFPVYLEKSQQDLLADLAVNRSRINAILEEIELLRTGRHPKFGLMTVAQWTEFFLLHEAHHLFTIFKLVGEFKDRPRQ